MIKGLRPLLREGERQLNRLVVAAAALPSFGWLVVAVWVVTLRWRTSVRSEMNKYGVYRNAYKTMKPGITGLWQVTGRSDCSYDERVSLDVDYVKTWSILRDINIIAKTAVVVFARKGSY